MAISRYDNIPILDRRFYATQTDYSDIKALIDNGAITTFEYITQPLDRLDNLAYRFFGDGRYWWIIAIVNDIGWSLQIDNGVILQIPRNIELITSRL